MDVDDIYNSQLLFKSYIENKYLPLIAKNIFLEKALYAVHLNQNDIHIHRLLKII